jgi:transcriptional regulator with XRE-family HTH domain
VSELPQNSLFVERLRESREKAGLSQKQLSRLCGLNLNQINRYERGSQEPTFFIMKKIAEVIGVSLDYLAGLTDDPNGGVVASDLDVYERELVDKYRNEGWAGVIHLGADRLSK